MRTVAAAAAGGLAAAAYLDGKYQLRRDLNSIRKLKRAERAYEQAGGVIMKRTRRSQIDPFAQSKLIECLLGIC